MSYILDALKKSEQERQRGTVPDLLTVQEELLQTPRRQFPWRYLLVAGMLLLAGASVWLFFPSEKSGTPAAPVSPQSAAGPVVPPERVAPMPPASVSLPVKRAEDPGPPVAIDRPDRGRAVREASSERSSSRREQPVPALQDTEKPAASPQPAALPPADPEKVYRLKELPAALQKTLPSFSLSAFMYSSNPALRVVRINNQMMREGQELTAGIRLQEITTDGVILASQGYRFFIAMK